MKIAVFILGLIYCFTYSQKYEPHHQVYFIGEKIEEKHESKLSNRIIVPAYRNDYCTLDENDVCKPLMKKNSTSRESIESQTTYKIIKVIKGQYTEELLNSVHITYISEPPIFEIEEAKKSKYVLMGVIRMGDTWLQCFTEKVYPLKNTRWILAYKNNYPFINYKKVFPQNLKNSEKVKIITDNSFYKTKHYSIPELVKPYYKKKKKYAVITKAFVF
ncbi:hypothetical protein [Chryseobacterium taiwanense]|uniref:Uncharacterized protein n=1 Tax=Chryseobacterium taiwanense TaxID=363331 RepID=A0A0B4DCR2_9FLAO|nr:hypothetical protein [Chryseobacterium taiwanense]KIC62120.1 hypothetical protein RM51_13745 [Chryseobacterium taiwanense]